MRLDFAIPTLLGSCAGSGIVYLLLPACDFGCWLRGWVLALFVIGLVIMVASIVSPGIAKLFFKS